MLVSIVHGLSRIMAGFNPRLIIRSGEIKVARKTPRLMAIITKTGFNTSFHHSNLAPWMASRACGAVAWVVASCYNEANYLPD